MSRNGKKKRWKTLYLVIFVGFPIAAILIYLCLLFFAYFRADPQLQSVMALSIALMSLAFPFSDIAIRISKDEDCSIPMSSFSAFFLAIAFTIFAFVIVFALSYFFSPESVDFMINYSHLPNILTFLSLMMVFLSTGVSNLMWCLRK